MEAGTAQRSAAEKLAATTEGRYSNSLNRSCEGCRARKIRCQPIESSVSGKCARCEKMKLSCIFLAPQQKRRRKRTDVRVAELEKELRYLRHRFEGRRGTSDSPNSADPVVDDTSPVAGPPDLRPDVPYDEVRGQNLPGFDEDDDDMQVDESTTELLFTKFKADLAPHFPFLFLREDMTAQHLRETRPILLDAILAASAESLYPPLGQALFHRMERLYAQIVFMAGIKSLELVQALLVTALWYHPPDRFSSLKFTTYAHLAANMALDIKLGRKPSKGKSHNGFGERSFDYFEASRAVSACYILCAIMGFSLRRPLMFHYSPLVESCIQGLEQCSAPGDHEIAAWARLMRIAEESGHALNFGDIESVRLVDVRTQSILKSYDGQLQAWKDRYWGSISSSVKINFLYLRASIHEIALHHEYAAYEFEPPYLMRSQPLPSDIQVQLIPAYVSSIVMCLECAQTILDNFFEFTVTDMRSAYVILHTRAFYSIIMLTKLVLATRSPTSGIGKVLSPAAIKIDHYMDKYVALLKDAASKEMFFLPATFLQIVMLLAAWYRRQEEKAGDGSPEELLEPFRFLGSSIMRPDETVVDSEKEMLGGPQLFPEAPPTAISLGNPYVPRTQTSHLPWSVGTTPELPMPANQTSLAPFAAVPAPWMEEINENYRGSPMGNNASTMFGGLGGGFESLWSSNTFDSANSFDDTPMLMFAGEEPSAVNSFTNFDNVRRHGSG